MCQPIKWLEPCMPVKNLQADDRDYSKLYPEDVKAIRETLEHPKLRKLAGYMEQKQWTKVRRMLRKDHAREKIVSSLPTIVLRDVYLRNMPPLSLVLDYMITERNAADYYISQSLVYYTFGQYETHFTKRPFGPAEHCRFINKLYIQHALLRHLRPDALVIQPALFHNTLTGEYSFWLDVATGDPRMSTFCIFNVFLGYPCCTYSLLTEAGFKSSPMIYQTTDIPAKYFRMGPEDSDVCQSMIAYCEEYDKNCRSLLHLCRNTIRRNMASLDRVYFRQLKLPRAVEKFLTLEKVDCPVFRRCTGNSFQTSISTIQFDAIAPKNNFLIDKWGHA